MNYQKLCREAGIDWAIWCGVRPDNSMAEKLEKFASLVVAEYQTSDTTFKACIAVDRDFEQSGAVSVDTVEKVREALCEVTA